MFWFIGEAVLVIYGITAGCKMIKLGFKAINRMFEELEDRL